MDVSSGLKVGDLVKAFFPPIDSSEEIDLNCLGVVQEIRFNSVVVSWPNIGLLLFKYSDLESIDH